eukprot:8585839-Pyramimonas_sp.AAC.1
MAAAGSAATRTAAVAAYEDRVHTPSSASSRVSLWSTWCKFHTAWFAGSVLIPVLPLTVESIKGVVSMMIRGGYRSAENYVSVAKDHHCEVYEWTTPLAREQKRANAAARRGIGLAHQCAELPIDEAWVAALAIDAEFASGAANRPHLWPVSVVNYLIVASFFLLREIEASLMLNSAVTIDMDTETVRIRLPVSKTDPQALSCTRSWGCVCSPAGRAPCPYHAAL